MTVRNIKIYHLGNGQLIMTVDGRLSETQAEEMMAALRCVWKFLK